MSDNEKEAPTIPLTEDKNLPPVQDTIPMPPVKPPKKKGEDLPPDTSLERDG
jgi:hypothetical protein